MEKEEKFLQNSNEIIRQAYKALNYRIVETSARTNNAIVFFSGNGLYFPNTKEVFENVILNSDRYEWENIAKNKKMRKYYKLIIFVRDIYKQWYIDGINTEINTRDKVIEFLCKETKGYKVSVCGNSAGGYMAVLCGVKMNAEKIFSFSGQFDIMDKISNENPLIFQHKDDGKYFSLISLISGSKFPDERIFYFFPGKSDADNRQYELIKNTCINTFRIDEAEHGKTIDSYCYPFLLTAKKEKLIKLAEAHKGKTIQKKIVSRRIVPFFVRLKRFVSKIILFR